MKLVKVNENKFCTTSSKVSVICSSNEYFITISGRIPKWQESGFSCIECAEEFLSNHNVEEMSYDCLPYSPDDFEFIVGYYGFNYSRGNWVAHINDIEFVLVPEPTTLKLKKYKQGKLISCKEYCHPGDLIKELDEEFDDSIFASIGLGCEKDRTAIKAASTKEIMNNMIRVKSSNVWSYTANVKDRKTGLGDIYVQFKGRFGGPGDVYVYYDVPIRVWRNWVTAPSKGHYFWQFIRNNYQYSKLTGDKKTHLKNGTSTKK